MTTTDRPAPPAPAADVDSEPHWANLRAHRLALQACTACDRRRFPPTPACPYCAHPESRWEDAPGTGTVYSSIAVHRTLDPAFADEVPYSIATVDLDGGGRMIARIDDGVPLDARVDPVYVDHEGWTELRFTAADES